MFILELKEEQIEGYRVPGYTWECPLCDNRHGPNLDKHFVESLVLDHMMDEHHAHMEQLRFEVKSG